MTPVEEQTVQRRTGEAVLVLLAVLLGIGSYWFTTRDFTPDAPRPAFDGHIALADNDEFGAFVVEATPVKDSTGSWSTVRLDVSTTNSGGRVLIALEGDARIAPQHRPAGDIAVPIGEGAADELWATDFSTLSFSGDGRVLGSFYDPEADKEATVDVLVGELDPEHCGNDQCGFTLNVPLAEPIISVAGGKWTVSTPAFGLPLREDPLADRRLFATAEPRDSVVDQWLKADWAVPSELDVTLDLSAPVVDSIQLSGTPPTDAMDALWRGTATSDEERRAKPELEDEPMWWPDAGEVLQVNGIFERLQVQRTLAAKDARQQFYAGILLSLAASLLMWALELWLGPRLQRRA